MMIVKIKKIDDDCDCDCYSYHYATVCNGNYVGDGDVGYDGNDEKGNYV